MERKVGWCMQRCDKSAVGTNNIYNDFDDEWSVTSMESIYTAHTWQLFYYTT